MALHLKWLIVFWLSFASTAFANDSETITFEKQKITVAGKVITVEIAETERQHERGLMRRESLGKDQGMLFVFNEDQPRSFWMKNTIINLSIGYFDHSKKLIDIQEMKAVASVMETNPPPYPSAQPATYALEMSEGWFKKNKIKLGAVFKFNKSVK